MKSKNSENGVNANYRERNLKESAGMKTVREINGRVRMIADSIAAKVARDTASWKWMLLEGDVLLTLERDGYVILHLYPSTRTNACAQIIVDKLNEFEMMREENTKLKTYLKTAKATIDTLEQQPAFANRSYRAAPRMAKSKRKAKSR